MQKSHALETNQNALTPSTDIPIGAGPEATDPPALMATDYELAHGETLATTLDLDTWRPGADLVQMYERLASEIREAVQQATLMQQQIRREIFPRLKTRPGAPARAG